MNLSKNTKIGTYSSGNKDRDLFSGFSAIPNEYISHKKSTLKASDGIEFGNYNFYVSSNTKVFKSDTPIYDGDKLILGTGGDFASVNYSINPFSSSGDTLVMSYEGLNNKYMYFYWKQYLDQITNCFQGTKLKHLKRSFFNNIILNVPSIEIQNKIEKILSKQQDYIDSIKTLLSNLETRNTYLADKLLSGEIRLRENEEGEIESYENDSWHLIGNKKTPLDWSISNFGSKCLPILGSGILEFDGEKRYYATGEVGEFNELSSEPTEYITYKGRTSRANMQPVDNSVWFARMKNTIKNIVFNDSPDDVILSTGFCGVSIDQLEFVTDYVGFYINSRNFNNIKNRLSYGSTQEAINNKSIKMINILKPSIKEQKLISNTLSRQQNEINSYKELLKLEEQRFEWLSESLLSGEYQLVD